MPQTPVVSIRLDRDAPIALGGPDLRPGAPARAESILGPGARLPSTRALAAELGVARGVVEQAFDQLVAEGWLDTRRGSGTFVADGVVDGAGSASARTARVHSTAASRPAARTARPRHRDARGSIAGIRQRGGGRGEPSARAMPPARYPDPAGLPELRAAVADYVGRQRGMACTAANVRDHQRHRPRAESAARCAATGTGGHRGSGLSRCCGGSRSEWSRGDRHTGRRRWARVSPTWSRRRRRERGLRDSGASASARHADVGSQAGGAARRGAVAATCW